ncbi:hypothetical protein B5E41_23830 [Rhizobium esperanzae]|uniref:Uncharacterized protein n=1 Tax=Rhizobium esperanzae TaxID=1967781 RepID=A0A246DS06_9HYPH|nr:hypothetical protein B5E41_23830 [Rhizobium esperanzae]
MKILYRSTDCLMSSWLSREEPGPECILCEDKDAPSKPGIKDLAYLEEAYDSIGGMQLKLDVVFLEQPTTPSNKT